MRVDRDRHFLYIQDISEREAKKMNANWLASKKMWRIPANLHSMRELYKIRENAGLLLLGKEQASREKIRLEKKNNSEVIDERLRPYQNSDVHFLRSLPHGGVFNQQRTGKTPTALLTIKDHYDLNIIVCPASLLLQWEGEVKRWIGTDVTIFVSKGTKQKRISMYGEVKEKCKKASTYLIISYETLRNDVNELMNGLKKCEKISLIVDEAHRLANYKSKQSQAVMKLGLNVHKRLALTGTPAMNHAADIYGILRFLYPIRYPGYWQFVERYFRINDGFFGKELGGYKRKEELQRQLELISVQRKRKDVMQWLPEKEYVTIELEGTKQQMKAYKSILDTFEFEHVDAPSVLAQMIRLRQILLAPELLELEGKSAKEEWIMEYIKDHPDEPIIVFSSFTSYLKKLNKKLKGKAVMIHGELSTEEKQKNANTFQKGKEGINVLLSNIKAGGTGWTLDRAVTTVFLDREFNPTLNEQAEDRMISTKEENVTGNLVIDLVVKDTIDEKIHLLLKEKEDIIKFVNNYGLKSLIK